MEEGFLEEGAQEKNTLEGIRIAVVEDEEEQTRLVRDYLAAYRARTGTAMTVRCFPDGEDILEDYQPVWDILLMDIQLPFLDGMSAAREIRKWDKRVLILFLTNMAGYAIEGYEVEAFDYILKPVSYEIFARKLSRAVERVAGRKEVCLALSLPGGMVRLPLGRILYIEARSHQMIYRTLEGEYSVRGRMEDLERELSPKGFFRSNRGYLVNLSYVTAVRDECCVVGGEKLPISRQRKAAFMKELTRIL